MIPIAQASRSPARTRFACLAATGLALIALASPATIAGDDSGARVQAGVRLFRTLLAADMGLEKKVDAEGRLVVLVFYASSSAQAERVAEQLTTPAEGQTEAAIRNLPVVVQLTSDPSFAAYQQHRPAAVFVAEAPRDESLRRIVQYGMHERVIVYSPFEGHVEKGVLAGLSVEAKVQPYINQATLDASHVELKPFFLKVSKFTR